MAMVPAKAHHTAQTSVWRLPKSSSTHVTHTEPIGTTTGTATCSSWDESPPLLAWAARIAPESSGTMDAAMQPMSPTKPTTVEVACTPTAPSAMKQLASPKERASVVSTQAKTWAPASR